MAQVTFKDREQELLESPGWKHRKLKIEFKPFEKAVQLDKGIRKLQKKAILNNGKITSITSKNMFSGSHQSGSE